jgi:two-component system cell cycle response regulator DivK
MRKVLVANGAQRGRELLRILLEHEGFEVLEASDGAAALEIARATLPDLILLDLELPAADGYTAVREMRRDELLKDRTIVAVTDSTRRADRERLVEAGFSGYIAKPVVLRVLREQLTQLAAQHQGQPEA